MGKVSKNVLLATVKFKLINKSQRKLDITCLNHNQSALKVFSFHMTEVSTNKNHFFLPECKIFNVKKSSFLQKTENPTLHKIVKIHNQSTLKVS